MIMGMVVDDKRNQSKWFVACMLACDCLNKGGSSTCGSLLDICVSFVDSIAHLGQGSFRGQMGCIWNGVWSSEHIG